MNGVGWAMGAAVEGTKKKEMIEFTPDFFPGNRATGGAVLSDRGPGGRTDLSAFI